MEVSVTAENRIRGMIELRECVRRLIEYQTEGYPDEDIQAEQKKLNSLYDSFTAKYGLSAAEATNWPFPRTPATASCVRWGCWMSKAT